MDFLAFRACCCGLLGLLGVAAVGFWTFRACCCGLLGLLGVAAVGFLVFWAFCCGLLPFQGVLLWASAPFTFALSFASDFQFRYALVTVGSGLAAVGLLGLRPYLKPANFKRIIQKKERK